MSSFIIGQTVSIVECYSGRVSPAEVVKVTKARVQVRRAGGALASFSARVSGYHVEVGDAKETGAYLQPAPVPQAEQAPQARAPINPDLLAAYRFHVARARAAGHKCRVAETALSHAREDVAAGRKRYTSAPETFPAVCWQAPKPFAGRERLGGLNGDLASAGLRLVGYVDTDTLYLGSDQGGGWYDNPEGESFKDGTGLITGAVYQLPGRKGKSRLVPGWIQGGTDCGPTIDFAAIKEVKTDSEGELCSRYFSDVRQIARLANQMAQQAAEEEKEYQEASNAGNEYSELGEEIKESRRSCLALLKEFRHARGERLEGQDFEAICRVIRASVKSYIRDIAKARARRAQLASEYGCYSAWDYNTDSRRYYLCQTFNQQAGIGS